MSIVSSTKSGGQSDSDGTQYNARVRKHQKPGCSAATSDRRRRKV